MRILLPFIFLALPAAALCDDEAPLPEDLKGRLDGILERLCDDDFKTRGRARKELADWLESLRADESRHTLVLKHLVALARGSDDAELRRSLREVTSSEAVAACGYGSGFAEAVRKFGLAPFGFVTDRVGFEKRLLRVVTVDWRRMDYRKRRALQGAAGEVVRGLAANAAEAVTRAGALRGIGGFGGWDPKFVKVTLEAVSDAVRSDEEALARAAVEVLGEGLARFGRAGAKRRDETVKTFWRCVLGALNRKEGELRARMLAPIASAGGQWFVGPGSGRSHTLMERTVVLRVGPGIRETVSRPVEPESKVDAPDEVAGRIEEMLKDEYARARANAVGALVAIRGKAAFEKVVPLLDDEDAFVITAAIHGLAGMRDRRGVGILLAFVEKYRKREASPNAGVLSAAAHAFGVFRAGEALPFLSEMAAGAGGPVWRSAVEALGRVGGADAAKALAPAVKRAKKGEERALVTGVLAGLLEGGVKEALEPALAAFKDAVADAAGDDYWWVRDPLGRLARAFGMVDDRRVLVPLLALLTLPETHADDDARLYTMTRIAANAALALGRLRCRAAVEPMKRMLPKMQRYWKGYLILALRVMGEKIDEDEVRMGTGLRAYVRDLTVVPELLERLRRYKGRPSRYTTNYYWWLRMVSGEDFGDDLEKWEAWWKSRPENPENKKPSEKKPASDDGTPAAPERPPAPPAGK